MAHFQGGVKGNRGPTSRLGTAKSGIDAFARGWDGGAHIEMWEKNGEDYIEITVGPHDRRWETTIVRGPIKDIISRAKSGGALK